MLGYVFDEHRFRENINRSNVREQDQEEDAGSAITQDIRTLRGVNVAFSSHRRRNDPALDLIVLPCTFGEHCMNRRRFKTIS